MQAAPEYDSYTNNPLIHRDRRLAASSSPWVRSFACDDMGVLIVCRGPIRKEAIDIFREMGMARVGILLSDKDSIVYPRALSPELRIVDPAHVHRVPDYSGASKEERVQRVRQIMQICHEHGYEYVFAGYGFMAEDADFVSTIENAGLKFIGPGSRTQRAAGAKDEAKRTAIDNRVSVTPGLNNAAALTLLAKHPDRAALAAVAHQNDLDVPALDDHDLSLEDVAEKVLSAAYAKHIDLYTIAELTEQLRSEAKGLLDENPGRRFRLKAIGGGGGKGQRIFSSADAVPGLAREVLNEVKATGVGDNKNILIELNIEETRHNEIQIIGNGEWCIALGGRDCSLQMHEQKLVEVSITQEVLRSAVDAARADENPIKAKVLEADLAVLARMEQEAERFGLAVGLDSASTFECIVEGERHYFMEVNTRIQVEHRVSELCYALRFTNPEDPEDSFEVHSLVECMALIAKHRHRLPKPSRVRRDTAAIEVRLNATDRALNPHAGSVIISWSNPIDGEIRDDQGISIKNPDTGLFMRYRLAGAYDSNIALLLATGDDRRESFERVAEILRRTTIRGLDLATNLDFHLGLVVWFLSTDVFAKPTTNFVVPYLTLVGELARETHSLDLDQAFSAIAQHAAAEAAADGDLAVKATQQTIALKETLLKRPIAMLIDEPHFLSAWLSQHQRDFAVNGDTVRWKRNPLDVLTDTYHLLHLDDRPGEPAAHRIWDHDKRLIDNGQAFYEKLGERVPETISWEDLDHVLHTPEPAFGFNARIWERIRAAHVGHQLGLDILALLPMAASRSGFFDLVLKDDMNVTIPERLLNPAHQDAMRKVLVPPPATKADEIVAAMGGTYYQQEAPGHPPFVTEGRHFEKGDPLYIIEVMKMFNKVYAPFSGTINKILVKESGVVVRKGQPLFKITPDERIVEEDPQEKQARIRKNTDAYLEKLLHPPRGHRKSTRR
jgi:acetyl/propionyl-CoA carboxylase alpha subunit